MTFKGILLLIIAACVIWLVVALAPPPGFAEPLTESNFAEFVGCANETSAMLESKSYPEHMDSDTRLLIEYCAYQVILCQMEFLLAEDYFSPHETCFKLIQHFDQKGS